MVYFGLLLSVGGWGGGGLFFSVGGGGSGFLVYCSCFEVRKYCVLSCVNLIRIYLWYHLTN